MKIMLIVGTRPELIRLSLIIPKLDNYCEQILVHTGQNFDYELDKIFFEQLGIREPNYYLNARGSFAEQIATILVELEKIAEKEKPDKFLVLGDTNSSMGAIVMKRLGIPVYHAEAGNRSYSRETPEETNRMIIDHSSDILMPYTQNSKERLIREGVHPNRIFVTGNPIFEVINHFKMKLAPEKRVSLLVDLNVKPGQYFLVTLHRQENVDNFERLKTFIESFEKLHSETKYPVIISAHPRFIKMIRTFSIPIGEGIQICKPFGFLEFLELQENALCVLTDSGTVMEETCILKVPCVILRDSHERPECQEVGSCIISGCDTESICSAARYVVDNDNSTKNIPSEYLVPNVSDIICQILLSKFRAI